MASHDGERQYTYNASVVSKDFATLRFAQTLQVGAFVDLPLHVQLAELKEVGLFHQRKLRNLKESKDTWERHERRIIKPLHL